jgi:hypothetical protein
MVVLMLNPPVRLGDSCPRRSLEELTRAYEREASRAAPATPNPLKADIG